MMLMLMMVVVSGIVALVVVLLLLWLSECANGLDGSGVGVAQRLEDIDEFWQMGGSAFLQQLYSSIELRNEPQHVVLQSPEVLDCVFSWVGVVWQAVRRKIDSAYAMLQLLQQLVSTVGIEGVAGLLLGLHGLSWLLLCWRRNAAILRWLWWLNWPWNKSYSEIAHQVVDCGVDVLREYVRVGLRAACCWLRAAHHAENAEGRRQSLRRSHLRWKWLLLLRWLLRLLLRVALVFWCLLLPGNQVDG